MHASTVVFLSSLAVASGAMSFSSVPIKASTVPSSNIESDPVVWEDPSLFVEVPAAELQVEEEPESEKPKVDGKVSGISKIYYINPPHLGDRNKFMQKQLKEKSEGIPFERFRATTEHEVANQEGTYSNGKVADYLVSWGGKPRYVSEAIYITHAKLMDKILNEDAKPEGEEAVLILEDDIQLNSNWHKLATKALEKVPEDWDMVKLSYWGDTKPGNSVNDFIQRACCHEDSNNPYMGMQAYLVRPSHVPSILQAMKHRELMDIDKVLLATEKKGEPNIKAYAITESIGTHTNYGGTSRWMLRQREKSLAKIA